VRMKGRPGSDVAGPAERWMAVLLWPPCTLLRAVQAVPPCAPAVQAAIKPRGDQPTAAKLLPACVFQRDSCVVVAVFAADVVHLFAIKGVGSLDGIIPTMFARLGDWSVAPHATHHEVINTNAVWACKVVNSALAVGDTHMAHCRTSAGAWDQRERESLHVGGRAEVAVVAHAPQGQQHVRGPNGPHTMELGKRLSSKSTLASRSHMTCVSMRRSSSWDAMVAGAP